MRGWEVGYTVGRGASKARLPRRQQRVGARACADMVEDASCARGERTSSRVDPRRLHDRRCEGEHFLLAGLWLVESGTDEIDASSRFSAVATKRCYSTRETRRNRNGRDETESFHLESTTATCVVTGSGQVKRHSRRAAHAARHLDERRLGMKGENKVQTDTDGTRR